MNDNMNISQVETYIDSLVNLTVSEHTFVGKLPDTIASSWNDMLLIDCGNGVIDLDAYGSGTVLLFTYARPRSNGTKNVTKLKAMDEAVNRVLEAQDSSAPYYLYRRKTYSDYDSARNWHCNIITLGITVK